MALQRQRIWIGLIAVSLMMMALGAFMQTIAQENAQRGTILTLNGPVTPPVAEYLQREISAASARGEELIILEIDTPGGLIDSMKTIIKAILASETPVVTYVSPQGARSASAGLYIMYGSHVAAMAPATNTGSATPISMGANPESSDPVIEEDNDNAEMTEEIEGFENYDGVGEDNKNTSPSAPVDISDDASLRGKIIEDSVAYIRGLAQERGRNAEWAEKAVRPPSASVTAREALELGVIEIVAKDLDDLMVQLDGRIVDTIAGEKTLATTNVVLSRVEPTMVEKVLMFLADPNVAAILFSLGSVGLIAEIWNPGSIFPGVFGALCLALAFYSFQVLPTNGLFLALMGLGVMLMVIEAFTPTFGLAGVSGLALFGVGLYNLYPAEFRVDEKLLIGTLAMGAVMLGTILFAVVGSRGHGPLIGQEAIRRRRGEVEEWDGEEGYVIVDGERWRARSKEPLKPGDEIIVRDIDGIVLIVRRASAKLETMKRLNPFSTTRDAKALKNAN